MILKEVQLLVASLRWVLRAELGLESDPGPVTSPVESAPLGRVFGEVVARHRVEQVLAPHAEALGLSPDIADVLRLAHRQSRLDALISVADTASVSSTLADAGIDHLVLKGVALAQQTTGSPVGRGPGDVDLLVSPADVIRAVAALSAAGIERDVALWPPPNSPLIGPSLRARKELLLWRDDCDVDLHWRLDVASDCLAWTFEELAGSAEWLDLGGVQVPTLSRLNAAVFNASHSAVDSWSVLRGLVDDVRLRSMLDEREADREARRVGASRRLDLARVMGARLLGEAVCASSTPTRVAAERMWEWMLSGDQPLLSRSLYFTVRGLAAASATYDSPRAAGQHLVRTVGWPVEATASRRLGDVGDRHPWLYPAATPYFRGTRLLERAGFIRR